MGKKDFKFKDEVDIDEDIDMNSEGEFMQEAEYFYEEETQLIQLFLFAFVSFALPFVLPHAQLFLGSVVNMLLVLAALNLKGQKVWTIILMPSLGVLVSGAIFGSLSKFLLYFIPMIWIANAAIVFGYKYMRFKHNNGAAFSISTAIIVKVGLLSTYAFALVYFGVVPTPMLKAMSVVQLMTACIGAVCAFVVMGVSSKVFKLKNGSSVR